MASLRSLVITPPGTNLYATTHTESSNKKKYDSIAMGKTFPDEKLTRRLEMWGKRDIVYTANMRPPKKAV